MSWIQTHSGKAFDYQKPTIEMVDLRDIARCLARMPRYMAQTNILITVAEHCMYVADNLPEHLKLEGLMHDAAEAYMGDMPSPLKRLIPEFKAIEHRVETVIAKRYGLKYPWPKEVMQMDLHALYCETNHLFTRAIDNWHEGCNQHLPVDNKRLVQKCSGMNKNAAKVAEEFLAMAGHLMLKRNIKP